MSLEVLNSAAAMGTFIVIGATAIAAVVQLRHLRASNQLQGLLTVLARVEDASFNEWVTASRRVIAERLPDPVYRKSIVDGTFETMDNPWLNLANSYEWVGSLVRQGLISEVAFMDIYSSVVIRAWEIVEEVTALRRREKGPAIWENFEYIYVRAKQWETRYPDGLYPRTVQRAAIKDKWLVADAGQTA
jgi:Domain of unknown function (DUF4760)